jgi:hypothetical protein
MDRSFPSPDNLSIEKFKELTLRETVSLKVIFNSVVDGIEKEIGLNNIKSSPFAYSTFIKKV